MKTFLRKSWVGRVVLIPLRLWVATNYFFQPWLRVLPWLFRSRETTNFTADLTDLSKETLVFFVAEVSGASRKDCRGFLRELETDAALREHVRTLTISGPRAAVSDPEFKTGKGTMSYLLTRAMKPRTVVEAGVDKGLGSCVIAAALLRNAAEGHPGFLHACDISRDAGFLFQGRYAEAGALCFGDALVTIAALTVPVDLFFQDIAPGLEDSLLKAVETKLTGSSVVCSVWHTGDLLRFAEATGRRFLVFKENLKDHWYGGGQLAVAFPSAHSSARLQA